MPIEAPTIDPRAAGDVERQVTELLCLDPRLGYQPAAGPGAADPGSALIHIFSRFAGLVIDRLNQAPEKHFLAFLNMLGVQLAPPQPARVPLSFTLAEGATRTAEVPPGAQVAAPPAEGEREAVLFETEEQLVLTPTRLVTVCVRESAADSFGDYSADGAAGSAFPAFTGDHRCPHHLYLAFDDELLLARPTQIALTIPTNDPAPFADLTLAWAYWNGSRWQTLARPDTQQAQLVITDPPLPQPSAVDGRTARWIRAELGSGRTASGAPLRIQAIDAAFTFHGPPERCLADTQPADPNTVFSPFGAKPRTGAAFYLGSPATFARREATVTVTVTLDKEQPAVPSKDLKIVWEVLCRTGWQVAVAGPEDEATKAQFNEAGEAHAVTLTVPPEVAPGSVGGVAGLWLRARIVAGNYGEEARYTPTDVSGMPGHVPVPATFAPPQIIGLRLRWTVPATPQACLAYNDFRYSELAAAGAEQDSTGDARPALYLGFDRILPNQPLTLYVAPALDGSPPSRLVWEYACNEPSGWAIIDLRDETDGLSRRGLLKLIAPADWAPRRDFGQHEERFWLRTRPDTETPPRVELGRIITNTTWARQSRTVRNELLGSSTGQPDQRMHTSARPVLEGQQLDVREPAPIEATRDWSGRPPEGWVQWQAVQDFYASGPHDRHYVLNHLAGEVRFGDGRHGMVPPTGRDNIRMTCYSTGGGRRGNQPPGAIRQFQTAVPYVESVINHEPAAGGADAETVERVKERGPTFLRHRDRAVTAEDFADLACAASPEVAHAQAVAAPGNAAGLVRLVIVPFADIPRPSPSPELVRRVEDYIRQRCAPAVTLEVVGPAWDPVSLEATVVLRPEHYHLAGTLLATIAEELARFLHPLSGGFDGRGWPFGRRPHDSDLYRLLTSVEGVDHVTLLPLAPSNAPAANHAQGQRLVCSGVHTITLKLSRDEA